MVTPVNQPLSASHFHVCAQLLHVPVVWVCPWCACAFLLHVLLEGSSGPDLVALPSGERPFHCTLCEKAFNQKSALQVHMKKHTGERPYKCDYCVMGFTQKSNMKLHMKRAHSYTGALQEPAGPQEQGTEELSQTLHLEEVVPEAPGEWQALANVF
uniref:Zinc finger protein 236 n=1 Tax=Myotis myotis TaxID=51298 RepID=A0A7J7W2H9_MYOMY|nr:zinc finger protein 236 [Myotis myotis]